MAFEARALEHGQHLMHYIPMRDAHALPYSADSEGSIRIEQGSFVIDRPYSGYSGCMHFLGGAIRMDMLGTWRNGNCLLPERREKYSMDIAKMQEYKNSEMRL